MVSPTKNLFDLTAADLMTAPLIVIPEEMSLKRAAHQLANASITGAPVVNQEGGCVGVLSATDFLHWMDRSGHTNPAACAISPAYPASWQHVDIAGLPEETVRDYMTRDPVMVSRTATLGELAYKMIDVHIHRVIVTDQIRKPIGIVTSTDVLAAVARADQIQLAGCAAAKAKGSAPCCS